MDFNEEQFLKAYASISVRVFGSFISLNDVQPSKAFQPILITPSGIVTEVIPVLFLNASLAMDLMSKSGIFNTLSLPV